jgi:hypothetical protein
LPLPHDPAGGGLLLRSVSEGRHANYPSESACDRGHFYLDRCDDHGAYVEFPVIAGRNIGSEAAPIRDGDAPSGCVRALTLFGEPYSGTPMEPLVVAGATECFWSDTPFRGWQASGEGSTPYLHYLRYLDEL